MRVYITLLLISLSVSSFAGDILIGQYSNHFEYCKRDCVGLGYKTKYDDPAYPDGRVWVHKTFREEHPLIGYKSDNYTVLIMKNSFDRVSVAAMRNFSYDLSSNLRPYASVGVATGYHHAYDHASLGVFTPVALLSLDIHPSNDKFGLIVSWVPTVMVSAGFRFKY